MPNRTLYRPDGVKPCPAHGAKSCEVAIRKPVTTIGCDCPWQVVADCGTAGPDGQTREKAVAAWNAMPRRDEQSCVPLADGRWRDDYAGGGDDQ